MQNSLPLPQLRHFFGAFVEGGDDFGVGEGAGVDADFVVGRGDESAEDERRWLLQREFGFHGSVDSVITIELEQHTLAVLLRRKCVETGLAGEKVSVFGVAILLLAKGSKSGKPFLCCRPPPKHAVVLALSRRRKLEDIIIAGAKPLFSRRCPDLNRERHEGDRSRREFEGRAGLQGYVPVLDSGVVGLQRRDVADGIGEAVRERPAVDKAGGVRRAHIPQLIRNS